nr:MAG TPA: hypothetical protein [Caudoviricetes sp.]
MCPTKNKPVTYRAVSDWFSVWCHRESNQGHKDFQSHNYIFE